MKIQTKKTIVVLLAVLLASTLVVSTASAKTPIKNYPSKYEILNFVSYYQGQDNFVNTASYYSKYYNPAWPWDIWQDKHTYDYYISFYYKINDHKYGSIYFDDYGNQVKPGKYLKLVESYKGT
jgi:hypothetical protein